MKRKIGIVLAGGGGNGAYQVGVWKYLSEIGLAGDVEVFSGTSVGALNAALFATSTARSAENLWTRSIDGEILLGQEITRKNLFALVRSVAEGSDIGRSVFRAVLGVAANGVWSRNGLLGIMDGVSLGRLNDRVASVYATCFEFLPRANVRHFRLNGRGCEEMKRILLATSAIPFVFKPEFFDGSLFYDGGLKCNVPIEPLVLGKCTDAIVVHLSHSDKITGIVPDTMRVLEIRPSIRLGKTGVLNFSSGHAKKLIALGYEDCKRVFEKSISISSFPNLAIL